ncbi:MAG: ribonuclease HI family protein [Patescibacteria group bacterium]
MSQLTVFTDGGARGNPGPAAIGVVVQQDHKTIHEHNNYLGEQTNNVAEYEALLYSIGWCQRFCETQLVESIEFLLDSKLVVEQVQGHWKVKEPHLQVLVAKARTLLSSLPCSYSFRYIPRAQNAAADKLVNESLDEAVNNS